MPQVSQNLFALSCSKESPLLYITHLNIPFSLYTFKQPSLNFQAAQILFLIDLMEIIKITYNGFEFYIIFRFLKTIQKERNCEKIIRVNLYSSLFCPVFYDELL